MAQQHTRPPFPSFPASQVAYSGPMSYNPGMHGSTSSFPLPTPLPHLVDPSTLPPDPTYYDISIATHKQIASLQAKLDQKLGPEYISQRPGPGGGPKLTYAEGWKIINLANEIFGFNGWSSSICSLSVDYIDAHEEGRRWNCGVSAVVRVTLRDGVYHEDVGYGTAENVKSKGTALDKCKKEAVTDAIKRTLRNFGNLMGNCLYDKQYTQEIVKMKVQPSKLDRGSLHRRPECEEKTGACSKKIEKNAGTESSTSASSNPRPLPQPSGKTSPLIHVKPEPGAQSSHITAQRSNPHSGPPRHTEQFAPPFPANRSSNGSILASTSTSDEPPAPVPPLAREPDEAYFNSDDDALLMQLDMEGMEGMVLEDDCPVEYVDEPNEGISVPRPEEPGASTIIPPEAAPGVNTNKTHGQVAPQVRRQQLDSIRPQLHGGQQNLQERPPQRNPHPDQENPPQHRPQPQLPANQKNPQQHNTYQPNPLPQQQIAHQQRSHNQHSHHQRQRPPHQASKHILTPNITASRPTAPSMGGFHFPSGIDPFSRPPNGLSGPSTSEGPKPAQVAGMKRSADSMSSAMPRVHQGHTSNASNVNSKARTPFSPLEVGESGDVKRMRR